MYAFVALDAVEGYMDELTIESTQGDVVGYIIHSCIFAYWPRPLVLTGIRPFRGHDRFHGYCVILCNKLHQILSSLDYPDRRTFLQFWRTGIFDDGHFIKFVSAGSRRQSSSGIISGSMVLKVGLCVGDIYSTHQKQGKECFQSSKKCAHFIDGHRVTQGKLPHATQGYYLWKYEPIDG
jgi:hypothetical protein